jgi:hypothetical protein
MVTPFRVRVPSESSKSENLVVHLQRHRDPVLAEFVAHRSEAALVDPQDFDRERGRELSPVTAFGDDDPAPQRSLSDRVVVPART